MTKAIDSGRAKSGKECIVTAKTKIFLTCYPRLASNPLGYVMGYAADENGHYLASHLSSGKTWSKHDMGLTSDWKHDHYAKRYPDGFELVWIDNPEVDECWQGMLKKYHELEKEKPGSGDFTDGCTCSVKVTVTND